MHSLLSSELCDGEKVIGLLCSVTGKRAVRELQQQWAQHSCQEKKRLVLQKWYCRTRKQKYAAFFWERRLLHRLLSHPQTISEASFEQRAVYVAENPVCSDQIEFESTAGWCVNGAAVGVLPWGCSCVNDSATHSLTLSLLFSFTVSFLSGTSVQP